MNPGKNCKSIENPEERLKCYDGIISGETFEGEGGNFEERFRDVKGKEMNCAAHCSARNEKWDGLGGGCRCYAGEINPERQDEFDSRRYYDEGRREFQPPQEFREGEFQPPEGFQEPPREGEFQQPPTQQIPSTESGSEGTTTPENSPPSESSESSGESSESSSSSSSGESSGGESSGGSITGNAFLDYYFK